jgi:hypothetical protein
MVSEALTQEPLEEEYSRLLAENVVGKLERERQLGRPRHRWKDNIKMGIREIGWEGVDWMHLAQDGDQWRAVTNTVTAGYFLTS